jgi:hypothetical protein
MTAAVRKLAAILAADVVGYSRMMGEDEADTAKAVRERREPAAAAATAFLGRNDEAVVRLRRSIEDNRNNSMSHLFLAAALALLGRPEDARATAKGGLALNPQFIIARYQGVPWRLTSVPPALEAQFIDALRRSGVPE